MDIDIGSGGGRVVGDSDDGDDGDDDDNGDNSDNKDSNKGDVSLL